MVWKILRPHYWMLDRRVRKTNRVVVVALILLLGFGGKWIFDSLIRENLALLSSEQVATAIASSLPLGLMFLFVFALLGVGDVLHQLYLASDLELLMVAPIPVRTIFLVKLLQCSRATFVPALGLGTFLLALGLARGAAVSYYLLILLLILVAMALTTAAVMILVILLARLLPAQKTRSWMPVLVALAMLVLILGQQAATQWFLGQTALITFLTRALLDPEKLALVVAALGGLALVTSLGAYQIFATAFHEGWDRLREVPTRREPLHLATRRWWGISQLVRPLPQPLRCFLVKEWTALRRNPRDLIGLAQPLVLAVIVLALFMRGGKGIEPLRPLFFWFMLMFLGMFLSVLPMGMPLLSIAQEGRKIALLRSAPISMSDVLKCKFWATWVPMVLSWTLVFLVAGMWLQFPLWQVGFLVGMTIWGLAGGSLVTMAIGALRVDFMAEELKQRMPTVTGYLLVGLNSIFGLLTIGTCVWLMVRLFPDSRVVLAVQALAGYGPVGWIFSDKLWMPLTLVGSQVLFWLGAKALWAAAVRRLEGWEEI